MGDLTTDCRVLILFFYFLKLPRPFQSRSLRVDSEPDFLTRTFEVFMPALSLSHPPPPLSRGKKRKEFECGVAELGAGLDPATSIQNFFSFLANHHLDAHRASFLTCARHPPPPLHEKCGNNKQKALVPL